LFLQLADRSRITTQSSSCERGLYSNGYWHIFEYTTVVCKAKLLHNSKE
jgi:hypothetical protein